MNFFEKLLTNQKISQTKTFTLTKNLIANRDHSCILLETMRTTEKR